MAMIKKVAVTAVVLIIVAVVASVLLLHTVGKYQRRWDD